MNEHSSTQRSAAAYPAQVNASRSIFLPLYPPPFNHLDGGCFHASYQDHCLHCRVKFDEHVERDRAIALRAVCSNQVITHFAIFLDRAHRALMGGAR